MGLTVAGALRAVLGEEGASEARSLAFVGAGGKTSAIFRLAREWHAPAVVTATTHLGSWQTASADRHIVARSAPDIREKIGGGQVILVTGPIAVDDRTEPLDANSLEILQQECRRLKRLLLIEADGSRQRPLKAPGASEPAIPAFVDAVAVVAGLSGLGKPLSDEVVHRPQQFARLSGLQAQVPITSEALVKVLVDAGGGLKGIPAGARRILILNQAEDAELQAAARGMVRPLLKHFDAVAITDLAQSEVWAVHEPCAGIVLAAGEARRFGKPKQLLDWQGRPFVRAVAMAALQAGLSPVIVVVGANAERVADALGGLPVETVVNERWQDGQASSIRAGLAACPGNLGAAVFLLADQPQVTADVIGALVETHAENLEPIVAPLILEEKRGNPILFDRVTFPDLMGLRGDVGGRAILSQYPIRYVPWHDEALLLDIDTPEDYQRLMGGENL